MYTKVIANNIEITDNKENKINTQSTNMNSISQNKLKDIIKHKLANIPFSNKNLLYTPNKSNEASVVNENDDLENKNTLDKWDDILAKINVDELVLLSQEGVPYDQYESDQLESAIERVKENRTKEQEHLEKQIESKKRKLESVRGNKGLKRSEKQIISKLEEKGLPVTKENIEKISNALEMAVITPNISNQGVSYLLNNNLSFTINNLYKASYVASQNDNFLNGISKASNDIPSELLEQVKIRIEEANLEVNDDNINNAAWLIKEDIPITRDNLWKVKDLKPILNEMESEKVLNRITEYLELGIDPEKIDLSMVSNNEINRIINDFNNIDTNDLNKLINIKDIDLSLREIKYAIDKYKNIEDESNIYNSSIENISIDKIIFRRNLEEVRLKLSLESGKQLIKNGFNLETDRLSKIVEGLRSIEDDYYNKLLVENNLKVNSKNLSLVKDTINGFDLLKDMPASLLGRTLNKDINHTASSLLEEGNKYIVSNELVGKSYETLMTKPDRNYGDGIEKAFENIDEILDSLNLARTEDNKRAIRILAYNEIDINIENIKNIKAYDSQVNYMLKSLNPYLITSFIKKGINPLEMPISKLNKQIKGELINLPDLHEEKFSKFLWKLERSHEISEKDKESYIGIYRLVYQVYKNGEAALGSLIKSGADVTLKNLLTAIRTISKGKVDIKLDKDFGMLEDILNKDQKIDIQINQGYINNIYDNLSPEKLHTIDDGNINGRHLEELNEELGDISTDNKIEHEYYQSKLAEIESNLNFNKDSIKYLESLGLPVSLSNLHTVTNLLSQNDNFYLEWRRLLNEGAYHDFDEWNGLDVNNISEKLIDNFDSPKELKETYKYIESNIKEKLKFLLENKTFTSKDANNIRNLSKAISFIKKLSDKDHYQLPIVTGETVTNVNLTILRSDNEKGKVTINVPSQKLGYVTIHFQVKNKELSGLITCDSVDSLSNLKSDKDELLKRINKSGLACKYLYYSLENDSSKLGKTDYQDKLSSFNRLNIRDNEVNDIVSEAKSSEEEVNRENNDLVQTKYLYELSKEILIYIRELENY